MVGNFVQAPSIDCHNQPSHHTGAAAQRSPSPVSDHNANPGNSNYNNSQYIENFSQMQQQQPSRSSRQRGMDLPLQIQNQSRSDQMAQINQQLAHNGQ